MPEAAPVATPVPAPAEGGLPWLWIVLGALAAAGIGVAGWLLGRRQRVDPGEVEEAAVPPPRAAAPRPAPVPAPPPPAMPASPPPRLASGRPAAPADPIAIAFHPVKVELVREGVVIDFELILTAAQPAGGVRLTVAMTSASPDQDRQIAAFHATPPVGMAQGPFDLPAGQGGRLPGRLTLPRDRFHIVEVGGRQMFVPLVLIDLRWNGGLSIRQHGADFMIGTEGQGGKLGPIWLDRGGPVVGSLAASRYFAKKAVAA